MLKKTIQYENYDGEQVSEDFYFNLSKAELMSMEMASGKGGFEGIIKEIIASEDGGRIVELFQKLILDAYGQRSIDGRHFRKTDEIREDFKSTNAYSELFIELATNAEAGAAFVKGIVPSGLGELAEEQITKEEDPPAVAPTEEQPKDETAKTIENYSREDLANMSQEDFDKLAGTDPLKMDQRTLQIAMQRKSTRS